MSTAAHERPTIGDSTVDHAADIVAIRQVVADVETGAARAVTERGELIDRDPAMVALYVLVREHGRWWVAARQNTPVPAPA